MECIPFSLGALETNCYLLIEGKDCIIFDPGAESERVMGLLEERNLEPAAILLTHGHFDHIGGVDDIRIKYGIPVYIHEKERDWLTNPALNGSMLFFPGSPVRAKEAEHLIEGEGMLTAGPFTFTIMETPGHSPGSVSYYVKEAELVIAGDTLFHGSIGRTDLPGGSFPVLMETLTEKLTKLPKNTKVLPGHGPITTIGDELAANPFLTNTI